MTSAKEHIEEIIAVLGGIFKEDWATIAEEVDPQTGDTLYKVHFSSPVPVRVATRVFNAATEIRSALDHVVYVATTALTERADPSKAKFPFGDTAVDFDRDLMRGADHVPAAITSIIRAHKPYEAGNRTLWALNKLRNVKDHRRLIVPAPSAKLAHVRATDLSGYEQVKFSLYGTAGPHNDYVVARVAAGTRGKLEMNLLLHVAFGEVEAVKGLDPVGFLIAAHTAAAEVIWDIEKATIAALKSRA